MTLMSLERRILEAAAALRRAGDRAPVSRGRSRELVLRCDGTRQFISPLSGRFSARVSLIEVSGSRLVREWFTGFDVADGSENAACVAAAGGIIAQVRMLFDDHARLWSYACNPHDREQQPGPIYEDDET